MTSLLPSIHTDGEIHSETIRSIHRNMKMSKKVIDILFDPHLCVTHHGRNDLDGKETT